MNAAMAEIPSLLCEEFLRRRIVHVHARAVRKDKFHESERVLGTWHLPDVEFPSPELREHISRHRSRRDNILTAVHYLESFFTQIFGVLSDSRQEFSFGDRIRNIPVWPEHDILHGVAE